MLQCALNISMSFDYVKKESVYINLTANKNGEFVSIVFCRVETEIIFCNMQCYKTTWIN